MRKILFRGKNVDTNEWVYGAYLPDEDSVIRKEDSQGNWVEITEPNFAIYDFEKGRWYDVDPETVGQFSGFQDKNDVDIYEEDQLYICAGYTSTVKFKDGMFVSVYEHPEDGETIPLCDIIDKNTEIINEAFLELWEQLN